MIRLDTITKTIELKLGTSVVSEQASIVVSYSDKTSAQYIGATKESLSDDTNYVTICDAPLILIDGSVPVRDVDTIIIVNNDNISKKVFVYLNDDGVRYTLSIYTIPQDGTLIYTHSAGWVQTTSPLMPGVINLYLDGVLQSSTPSSDLNAEIVNVLWV